MEEPGHRRTLPLLLLAVVLTACSDCPDPFELTERRLLRPGERVLLTVGDGELSVTGRERMQTLEIEARGCGARDAAITIDTAGGDRVVAVTAGRADVRVLLPAAASLVVRHGSGRAELRAVGPTVLTKRGGDARIEQSIGDVSVRAGGGSLYVREVVGDVDIVDGAGAIFVESVAGRVRLHDRDGGIHLREIDGDVLIEEDGGGVIDARVVRGDLTVRAKSGDRRMIRWNDVSGRVTLPD